MSSLRSAPQVEVEDGPELVSGGCLDEIDAALETGVANQPVQDRRREVRHDLGQLRQVQQARQRLPLGRTAVVSFARGHGLAMVRTAPAKKQSCSTTRNAGPYWGDMEADELRAGVPVFCQRGHEAARPAWARNRAPKSLDDAVVTRRVTFVLED